MNRSSSSEAANAADELNTRLNDFFRTIKTLRPQTPSPVPGLEQGALPVLFALHHCSLRVSALAEACHADTSTASRYATTLTRLGLVEKNPDENDRRAQVLVITDAGREVVNQVMATRRALVREILADWDTDDVHSFATYLSRFATDVERHHHRTLDTTKED